MRVVTNRRFKSGTFTGREAADHALSYATLPPEGEEADTGRLARDRPDSFRRSLIESLAKLGEEHHRPCIIVPIHGYNTDWDAAVRFFRHIDAEITAKVDGAITVGFSWASAGTLADYLGDRMRARSSAIAFSTALAQALRLMQRDSCPAQIVIVAHSMGNYMISKAAKYASEMHGDPSFQVIAETLMVAADLDGNCFEEGGDARTLARFSGRVTAYRSVHDGAVKASRAKRAGLSGRRLGRQGVNDLGLLPHNVAVVDASEQTAGVGAIEAHSHHFHHPDVIADMVQVASGTDRTAIPNRVQHGGEFRIQQGQGPHPMAVED